VRHHPRLHACCGTAPASPLQGGKLSTCGETAWPSAVTQSRLAEPGRRARQAPESGPEPSPIPSPPPARRRTGRRPGPTRPVQARGHGPVLPRVWNTLHSPNQVSALTYLGKTGIRLAPALEEVPIQATPISVDTLRNARRAPPGASSAVPLRHPRHLAAATTLDALLDTGRRWIDRAVAAVPGALGGQILPSVSSASAG
jgi:hypothetical protein